MPKPVQVIKNLVDKFNLDEPSTYASLATGAVAFGVAVPEPITMSVSLLLAGVFSLFGVFKKEKAKA